MEYTNYFMPILLIFLTLSLGILIGCIASLRYASKEMKEIAKELDKFRELYFEEVRINSIIDSQTRTGALAR